MAFTLSAATRALVDGTNYAVLATINADGSPQSSVVWVGRDGDDVLMSTIEGRRKHRNMVRDPRVSLSVDRLGRPGELRRAARPGVDVP